MVDADGLARSDDQFRQRLRLLCSQPTLSRTGTGFQFCLFYNTGSRFANISTWLRDQRWTGIRWRVIGR